MPRCQFGRLMAVFLGITAGVSCVLGGTAGAAAVSSGGSVGSGAPALVVGTGSKSACTRDLAGEMRVHANGAAVRMAYGSDTFHVTRSGATRANLTAPYLTVGFNEGISTSDTCRGYGGRLYKMPTPIGQAWPRASLHTRTAAGDVFDTGFDLWFSKTGVTTYRGMTKIDGRDTTEIMVLTSHDGLFGYVHRYPVTVDGRRWAVETSTDHGWRVIDFVAPSTHVGNVTVRNLYLSAFASWAVARGWLRRADDWTAIDAGFEIAAGSGEAVEGYSLAGVPFSRK